ncbi:MAG: phosphatidylglycerophosphatase A [Gammaproteobacteria bacterium]|nr:phosphatidylglycerophosphatase A [Gammaproteobacteria bacterium]
MTNTPNPSFRELLANPVQLLAFGFGSGLSPWAPGTAGTVLAAAIWFVLPAQALPYSLALPALAALAGIWICGRGAKKLGGGDHPGIVWDEFAGCWITLALVPAGAPWALGGIALFRLLDIVKPWPIKWLDRNLKGGVGIMLDDVVAGIMAALFLQSLRLLA